MEGVRPILLWGFVVTVGFISVALLFCVGLNDVLRLGPCYFLLERVVLVIRSVLEYVRSFG